VELSSNKTHTHFSSSSHQPLKSAEIFFENLFPTSHFNGIISGPLQPEVHFNASKLFLSPAQELSENFSLSLIYSDMKSKCFPQTLLHPFFCAQHQKFKGRKSN
jgi:hypothetical protein